jgi:phage shock protein A
MLPQLRKNLAQLRMKLAQLRMKRAQLREKLAQLREHQAQLRETHPQLRETHPQLREKLPQLHTKQNCIDLRQKTGNLSLQQAFQCGNIGLRALVVDLNQPLFITKAIDYGFPTSDFCPKAAAFTRQSR